MAGARRARTILGAAAATLPTLPDDAHAAAVACGGGTATGHVAVNGCIGAERGSAGRFPTREITAYIKARNSAGPEPSTVENRTWAHGRLQDARRG
ncbi:hypothetical protein [Streptomyces subrutilus]|uniref:hypothetical protein n=1 Tax=Streptomyces subrutilus TaxID=36818 RepID=UPI002E0E91BF|nr:hypothetical protein OG479_05635 [Streptomyces subrutilus]